MSTSPISTPVRAHHHDLRNAWVSLALFPVAVLLAMVAGDVGLSLFGYDSADAEIPGWVKAAVGVPMVLVAVLPALGGYVFGSRARRAGDARGQVPAVVGLVLTIAFALQNLLAVLVG